ncbi:MAG: hypothetical protein ACI3XL_00180 [Eubacteriales bacterium]
MFEQNKTPYRGHFVAYIAMVFVPLVFTWIFYVSIMTFQSQYSREFNWASAKTAGCGIGVLYHLSCLITGAFSHDFKIVKNRLKEFFSDLFVSAKLAFEWYFEDIKTNGLAFWLDMLVIIINASVFVDAFLYCAKIIGWKF